MALTRRIDSQASRLETLRTALANLNPQAVLARGYSITRDSRGAVITDAARIAPGEAVTTTLAAGWLESEVRRKGKDPR